MFKNKGVIALMVLSCTLSWPATLLAERHSLASIVMQAESFIAQYPYQSPYPVEYRLSRLDKRLNLKPCAQDLDIEFTRSDKTIGNTSMTVKCPSPVNWQIHLPVQISLFQDVVVNKTPLVKGQLIDNRQIAYRKKDVSRLNRGYFRQDEPLNELQAKRDLLAGTVLNSSNLSPRQLVKSGQTVTIILNMNGLQIKSSGQALQSAGRGQVIKVKNTQSNRIVEGMVSAAGQITVQM